MSNYTKIQLDSIDSIYIHLVEKSTCLLLCRRRCRRRRCCRCAPCSFRPSARDHDHKWAARGPQGASGALGASGTIGALVRRLGALLEASWAVLERYLGPSSGDLRRPPAPRKRPGAPGPPICGRGRGLGAPSSSSSSSSSTSSPFYPSPFSSPLPPPRRRFLEEDP